MKKVLAIAPYAYLPFASGGQKFIAKFLEHLGDLVDLRVVSVASNDTSLIRNYIHIPLMKAGFSRYMDRSLISKIAAIIEADKCEWLICEHPYLAWLVFAIRKRTGVKIYIHTHNVEYQRFRSLGKWWWPLLRSYEKRCFKKADGIFFIIPQDMQFAIDHWKIDPAKCFEVPFGIDQERFPDDRQKSKAYVLQKHGLDQRNKLFLFAAHLGYLPNRQALEAIIKKINPVLVQKENLSYKLIICGTGLSAEWNSLKDYKNSNLIYAGFIEDIETYFKAADVSLNPVQTGGGIKTKMIEAIGYGSMVVATESGAKGIREDSCGDMLVVVNDDDWESFAGAIINHENDGSETPSAFYEHYSWKKILKNLYLALSNPSTR